MFAKLITKEYSENKVMTQDPSYKDILGYLGYLQSLFPRNVFKFAHGVHGIRPIHYNFLMARWIRSSQKMCGWDLNIVLPNAWKGLKMIPNGAKLWTNGARSSRMLLVWLKKTVEGNIMVPTCCYETVGHKTQRNGCVNAKQNLEAWNCKTWHVDITWHQLQSPQLVAPQT